MQEIQAADQCNISKNRKMPLKLQFVALCEHIVVAHEEILHGKLPAASFHCFLTHVMQHDRCNVANS